MLPLSSFWCDALSRQCFTKSRVCADSKADSAANSQFGTLLASIGYVFKKEEPMKTLYTYRTKIERLLRVMDDFIYRAGAKLL